MTAILVTIMFIITITIGLIVTKARKKKRSYTFTIQTPQSYAVFSKDSVYTPKGFYFAPNHNWVQIEKNGNAKVGIDDFLNKVLGSFRIKNTAQVGQLVQKGEELAQIEMSGKSLKINSPIDGKIISVNKSLIENPTQLRQAPYENGWIVNLEPFNLKENLLSLNIGAEVVSWMKNEISRFKDFLSSLSRKAEPVGVTLYDGGNICEGVLDNFDQETIKKFEDEFLK